MNENVERNAGHNVDEETSDFVEAVENHRVPPHGYCDRVVSKCQAVCADEQSFRVWEEPDGAHAQEVDKVAEISQEIMVSSLAVGVIADRHEVEELQRVPPMKILRIATDQVSTDQNVQNSTDE